MSFVTSLLGENAGARSEDVYLGIILTGAAKDCLNKVMLRFKNMKIILLSFVNVECFYCLNSYVL